MKTYEMDFTKGQIFKQILAYTLPLAISGILQILYNMVDTIVVGQFAGEQSLAAVGSTTSLINLFTNLLIGISAGSCVVIATYYGANKYENLSKNVHTSMAIALISGVLLTFCGFFVSESFLKLTGTPEDVLPLANLYMKIYFLGMPFFMVFNFGSSILNAVGDTKRPLYYLTVSGIVNVVLNLVFVIVYDLGVAGVAIATVISQLVSAVFMVNCLLKLDGVCKLNIRDLKIDKHELFEILKNGVPAGMSRSIFSFSNVIIQSSVNSLGSVVMAGSAAAANIEGIVYIAMYSIAQTTLTFISQNYGAKNYLRIKKGKNQCALIVTALGVGLGITAYALGPYLLKIYSSTPDIIQPGLTRMKYVCVMYFLCGLMDVETSALRGLSYSLFTMIAPIIGICGVRVAWMFTIFKYYKTIDSIFISFPVSWSILVVLYEVVYRIIIKRKIAEDNAVSI